MVKTEYYRGGNSLKPRPREVKIDRKTGLLKTMRGVSVFSKPDNLDRFGGAYRVTGIPSELKIVKRGKDPAHYEIVPAHPMAMAEYEEALEKIVLVPV